MATTNSTIEKIAPMFTDLLIKKIECLKTDWQKPWIASLEQGLPRNIRGTLYNGGNVLMLLFYTEFMKFTLPVFLTFNQAKEEDLSVSKGARSFPVYYWFKFVVHKETKKTIKYEEYRKLPATEQENYKVIPQMKYYNVFNIDQTDFAGKYGLYRFRSHSRHGIYLREDSVLFGREFNRNGGNQAITFPLYVSSPQVRDG